MGEPSVHASGRGGAWSRLHLGLLGCGGFVVLTLGVFTAVFLWLGAAGGEVRLANEVAPATRERLLQEGILRPGEELLACYEVLRAPGGLPQVLLTDVRLIKLEDGWPSSLRLDQVEAIEHRFDRHAGDIIEVRARDGRRLGVEIAPSQGGDVFLRALMDAWERAGEGSQAPGSRTES